MAALLPLGAGCDARQSTPEAVREWAAVQSTRGLDAGRVRDTLAAANRLPRLRSLVVMRDGEELVAERFNGGPGLDTPVNIKSASKSVMSALAGIAIERGVLSSTDQRIATVLSGEFPLNPEPRLGQVTVGHLL